MHSMQHYEWALHHNGDFSGEVIITRGDRQNDIKLPSDLLRQFVAAQVRSHLIAELEQKSDNKILGLEGE